MTHYCIDHGETQVEHPGHAHCPHGFDLACTECYVDKAAAREEAAQAKRERDDIQRVADDNLAWGKAAETELAAARADVERWRAIAEAAANVVSATDWDCPGCGTGLLGIGWFADNHAAKCPFIELIAMLLGAAFRASQQEGPG